MGKRGRRVVHVSHIHDKIAKSNFPNSTSICQSSYVLFYSKPHSAWPFMPFICVVDTELDLVTAYFERPHLEVS
jgi:hypothetical protein